jgi:hypothetical protein
MTQLQLERAVAGTTGESLRTVRGLGFGLLADEPGDPGVAELVLVVDCPFCRHPIALATGPGDEAGLVGCDHCDVEFDFGPGEIYVADGADLDAVDWAA